MTKSRRSLPIQSRHLNVVTFLLMYSLSWPHTTVIFSSSMFLSLHWNRSELREGITVNSPTSGLTYFPLPSNPGFHDFPTNEKMKKKIFLLTSYFSLLQAFTFPFAKNSFKLATYIVLIYLNSDIFVSLWIFLQKISFVGLRESSVSPKPWRQSLGQPQYVSPLVGEFTVIHYSTRQYRLNLWFQVLGEGKKGGFCSLEYFIQFLPEWSAARSADPTAAGPSTSVQ